VEKIVPGNFSERWERLRPYLGFSLLVLILVGGGVWALSESRQTAKPVEVVKSGETHLPEATSTANVSKIAVDVAGAVVSPGVYELPEDARVADALDSAGGLSSDADREWVAQNSNFAAKLTDGDKIYIPKVGEAAPTLTPSPSPAGVVSRSVISTGDESTNCSRVNINSASAATLDECLPGIGPVYAERIIEYREAHGGFKTIEEIQNVSGIGPKTFEKIKDQITVD
jgi:competence protein ComEA